MEGCSRFAHLVDNQDMVIFIHDIQRKVLQVGQGYEWAYGKGSWQAGWQRTTFTAAKCKQECQAKQWCASCTTRLCNELVTYCFAYAFHLCIPHMYIAICFCFATGCF